MKRFAAALIVIGLPGIALAGPLDGVFVSKPQLCDAVKAGGDLLQSSFDLDAVAIAPGHWILNRAENSCRFLSNMADGEDIIGTVRCRDTEMNDYVDMVTVMPVDTDGFDMPADQRPPYGSLADIVSMRQGIGGDNIAKWERIGGRYHRCDAIPVEPRP